MTREQQEKEELQAALTAALTNKEAGAVEQRAAAADLQLQAATARLRADTYEQQLIQVVQWWCGGGAVEWCVVWWFVVMLH